MKGRNPRREFANSQRLEEYAEVDLGPARYVGSIQHKVRQAGHRKRGDKSPCDDLRSISLFRARLLFRKGVSRGYLSHEKVGCLPKRVWSVDCEGQIYEAILDRTTRTYHGYRLDESTDRYFDRVKKQIRRRDRQRAAANRS